jgi:hypothetical protein
VLACLYRSVVCARIVAGWFEVVYEFGGVDAEAGGDLEEVVEVEVALSSLDLAEECPVDAGLGGEGLLAEAEGFALGADALSEVAGGGGEGFGHRPKLIRPDCLCPES